MIKLYDKAAEYAGLTGGETVLDLYCGAGTIGIWMLDELRERPVLQLCAMASCMYLADALKTDYNFKGVFLVAILYLFHDYRIYQCAAGAAAIAWEDYAPLSFILCYFYNGKRGLKLRYLFYWFYPGHLIILGILRRYVIPSFF